MKAPRLQDCLFGAVVGALALWPPAHLALSRSGRFSSWRKAGWGMYATALASAAQRPVRVIVGGLSEPTTPQGKLESVRIELNNQDVTTQLRDQLGLTVLCRDKKGLSLRWSGQRVLPRVRSSLRALRQLDTEAQVPRFAQLLDELVVAEAGPQVWLLEVGQRRADVWHEQYGLSFDPYVRNSPSDPAGPSPRWTRSSTRFEPSPSGAAVNPRRLRIPAPP